MPPYRVEYYCPRQSANWQRVGRWFLNPSGSSFSTQQAAEHTANSLLWQYHASRVLDARGAVVYQV